jgi:hypothetical protein
VKVTGSPAYSQWMPASSQPPTSALTSGDGDESQRLPSPKGSA